MKMELNLIAIGNSRGLRLPKALLDNLGPVEKVKATVNGDVIELRAVKTKKKRKPREGWFDGISREAIAADAKELEDWTNLPVAPFDDKDWTW